MEALPNEQPQLPASRAPAPTKVPGRAGTGNRPRSSETGDHPPSARGAHSEHLSPPASHLPDEPPPFPYLLVRCEDVPPGSEWLGQRERQVEAGLRELTSRAGTSLPQTHPRWRRLKDWRAGRWAAKSLLTTAGGWAPSTVEVVADPDGAPRVWVNGTPSDLAISISHRAGWAAAAVALDGALVGLDLERVEPRSERCVRDFFTEAEIAIHDRLGRDLRDLYAVSVWSAKEAVLKVARAGLRRDTRSVQVDLDISSASARAGRFGALDLERALPFEGWWSRVDDQLLTLVTPWRDSVGAR